MGLFRESGFTIDLRFHLRSDEKPWVHIEATCGEKLSGLPCPLCSRSDSKRWNRPVVPAVGVSPTGFLHLRLNGVFGGRNVRWRYQLSAAEKVRAGVVRIIRAVAVEERVVQDDMRDASMLEGLVGFPTFLEDDERLRTEDRAALEGQAWDHR